MHLSNVGLTSIKKILYSNTLRNVILNQILIYLYRLFLKIKLETIVAYIHKIAKLIQNPQC